MRLSDFKDEKAIQVVADLLVPISNIVNNAGTLPRGEGVAKFAGALLKNNPKDVIAMLAILNDVPVADYHCTAATVLVDTISMLSDPDLMELFGLRSKTSTSSGSASESTEVA